MIPYWIRIGTARDVRQIAEISDLPAISGQTVDSSFLAKANVTGDGNEPNTVLALTVQRADTGWAIASNTATFTGTPDKVRIDAMAYYQQNQNGAFARINPELQLLKNGTVVAQSGTGYQRHASNHDSSSNTIAFTDHSPGTNPQYQLRAQQGSSQNDVLAIDLGHFSLDAVVKVTL